MIKLSKRERQKIIVSVISGEPISTQEELVERLRAKGLKITQATVSRDIKELNIAKGNNSSGAHIYKVPGELSDRNSNKMITVFSQALISLESAGNILIIKTLPGMAPASASAIDSFNFEEVAGTIAGDDTIFVATKSPLISNRLAERIRSLLRENTNNSK